ncbi:MAG: molybdopterin-dependent oxidoreductase [Chloroflexi bacterium]|nr:molybdopterin-dependent oxidoreductase [Chloroflexota bacterium]
MQEYSVVGKRVPNVDSRVKVTGEATYVDDLVLPGMLVGKVLRSTVAHARIVSIDTSAAEKLPGVKAVVTGKDAPNVKVGWLRGSRDRLPLTRDKVRFIGEAIAAVAAMDEDTAEEALGLIKVQYEELPAVFDPVKAMKDGAPRIQDDAKNNIALERHWNYGDVEKGFRESDYVREDTFYTPSFLCGYMEPNAAVAQWDANGKLTTWVSSQAPFFLRRELSLLYSIPQGKVRVINRFVGGGFGGKCEICDVHVSASLLARKAGRPVKVVYTTEDEFAVQPRRIPSTMTLKTGVKKDGAIVAQTSSIVTDGGPYRSVGGVTIYNHGLANMIPYRIPNFKFDAFRVFTNNQVGMAKRGHGQIQMRYAVESQMDMIAEALGIDPVDIRLKNALKPGEVTVNGLRMRTSGLVEAIEGAARRSGWKQKRGKGRAQGRGIGISCGGFACGPKIASLTDSGAIIKVNEDAGIVVYTGASDIGQGSNTVVTQVVAEVLGIGPEEISVVTGDTDVTPFEPGTYGSRVSWYMCNAAIKAAEDLRRQIVEPVASKLEVKPEEIVLRNGGLYVGERRAMSFAEAVRAVQVSSEKGILIAKGTYYPPDVEWPDPANNYYGNIAGGYSFSAQIAEVEVDRETGQVKLLKVTAGDDIGYPLNEMLAEGQAEGSISMGQGETMYENIIVSNGRVMNPSLVDYKLPTVMDTPEMDVTHVITNEPGGPFGAKEVGEGFIVSIPGAIANAIHDATGVWIKELPITPEKIVKALEAKEKEGKS